jgi:hypothetical protein
MFSAADLIDTLRKRARRSLRPERPPGVFPPGWAQWFDAMAQRIGRITGATAEAIVAVFLQRELAMPPPSAGVLNRWQAFATLWRQQWQPPEREDRRTRIVALTMTVLVHLVLFVLLLWLADVRFTAMPPAAGDEVVQVEFVGQGTPRDQGGGPPSATPASEPAASRPSQTQAAAKPVPPSVPASPPQPPTPAPPSQAPQASAAPVVEQPLQVSATPVPNTTFVLPPPTPRVVELPQPQVAEPKLQAPVRDVELVPALPTVRALQPKLPDVPVTAPQLQVQPQQVAVIEPLPAVQSRQMADQPLPTPQLRQAPSAVPLREAPAATSTAATPSTASAAHANAATSNANPMPSSAPTHAGAQPAATASGRGPAGTAKPGAWPTPERGDDWGASTRNRPGGNPGAAPGLLNSDGTPRLAAGTAAAAGGGFPPGTDNWTRELLDRAGTWLKRPPNDYTPTRFDQYWVPNGTLLDEWVRRGVRELSIPIPGTSKKIQCVISILQLGGGCGISDPNLNDQEAIARPPPDIPFKPDLQEDQDSLKKPSDP